MTRLTFRIVLVIVGLGSLFLFLPLCYVFETNSRVEALAGPERLYLVVGLTKLGNRLSPARLAVCTVVSHYVVHDCVADARRDEIVIFEVTPSSITPHRLAGFPARGEGYIYDGQLYNVSYEESRHWRWSGSSFEELEESDGRRLYDAAHIKADVNGDGHWTRKDTWYPDSSGNSFQTTVDGVTMTVSVEGFLNEAPRTSKHSGQVRLRVTLEHPSQPRRVLLESDPEVQWFQYRKYASLSPSEGTP